MEAKNKPKGQATAYKCPKCNSDLIYNERISKKTGKPYKRFSCSAWRDTGCDFNCFANSRGEPNFNITNVK